MPIPVKIYCPSPTARHHFVFGLIFNDLLGSGYSLVSSVNEADINYSNQSGGLLHCVPYGLLSEDIVDGCHKKSLHFEKWEYSYCSYPTGGSSLPFDCFSAAFFLVTRYEEYLPYTADSHNRFPATESVLVQQNLATEPLVNQWAKILEEKLMAVNDELSFKPRRFEYQSTIDVDQAWKFKYKGLRRNLLGTFRDLKEAKWENLKDRWPILLGFKKDPFHEAFNWHQRLESKYNFSPTYFILLGEYGAYDKNVSYQNEEFIALIEMLTAEYQVGIHPSYASNSKIESIPMEIDRLDSITERTTTISRQHFLMHSMPSTYRNLIANGITEDHTMGYSTHLGFRAGIAAPFNWFDLERNKETTLRLVPFCAMDITPLFYRNETPEEAIKTLENLLAKVASIGGLFVSLWHNESFSETERWKGWSAVYEYLVATAKSLSEDV